MRKLALVAALVAIALGVSACDLPATDYAAQVGGTTITQATVTSTVSGVAGDSGFSCVLSSSGSELTAAGKVANSIGTSFAAALITDLIQESALRAQLVAEHLSVSRFASQLATDQILSELSPENSQGQAACSQSVELTLADLPTTYRNVLLELQADQDVLYAHKLGFDLTSAGFHTYAAAHGGLEQERCLSLIELKSLGTAKTVEAAIAHGANFATEAEHNSIDTQTGPSGGVAGCVPDNDVSGLTPPLDTVIPKLELGVVSAPVSIEGDYLLLLLTAIKAVPLDDDALVLLGDDAALFAQGSTGFDLSSLSTGEASFAAPVLDHENVAIAPAFGTWQKVDGAWEVVPPPAPSSSLLSNPSAVGDTGSTGAAGTTGGAAGTTGG